MSSGRFSGLATASKAISGAVWADAGSALTQVAASKANKKRFMVSLLPLFFVCGFWDWPKPYPGVIALPDFVRGVGVPVVGALPLKIADAGVQRIPRCVAGDDRWGDRRDAA